MFAKLFLAVCAAQVALGSGLVDRTGGHGGGSPTVTVTVTSTRWLPNPTACPTSCPDPVGAERTLNFDDTNCPDLCPVPLEYDHFHFNGASGWLFVNSTSKQWSPDPRVATTGTGALETLSSGWVDFSSYGATDKFTFDVLSFYFSLFSNDNNTDVVFFVQGTKPGGAVRNYKTTLKSGIVLAPYQLDFTTPQGQALDFKNLNKIAVQAFTNYNATAGTGLPATIVIDQFRYVRHGDPCAIANP